MAKKKKKRDVGVDSLELTKKAIIKKYGEVIGMMSDTSDVRINVIPSGSIGLDIALGIGGFARGRVYEIFGPPAGGKTTLTMSVIAQAQKQGLKCVFCDAEHSADPRLFSAMGVDITQLQTINAFVGDDNLDALEMLIKSKDGVDVAIVDSVSALIPRQEAEGEVGDNYIADLARLMSKATRKFIPLVAETNTLLIFINQIRNKIGVYGDPSTTSGGVALDFYATGRIRVEGGEFSSSHIKDENEEVIGHHTTFKIIKNKLSAPHKKAIVPLIYGVGYDAHQEVLKLALELGCIDTRGAWYYRGEDNLGQGADKVLDILRNKEEFYNEIRSEIIEMTGLKETYEQNISGSA